MYPYIRIFGNIYGTYGLCILLGFFLAGFLSLRKGKSIGFEIEHLLIIGTTTLGAALLGGGLLYVFVTYPLEYIWERIRELDFSFLVSGIVFYGGLIGGFFGALLGRKIAKCDFRIVERSVVPFIPIGHAIGRVGCVMGGCCHGFAYDGFCALYYPNSVVGLDPNQGYFPVQLLEGLINLCICVALLLLDKRIKRKWNLLFSYLAMYAVSRFFLELLRGDEIRGIFGGLSTSQYISLGLLAISIAGIFWRKHAQSEVE